MSNPKTKLIEALAEISQGILAVEGRVFSARPEATFLKLSGDGKAAAALDELLRVLAHGRRELEILETVLRWQRDVQTNLRRTDARRGSSGGRL